MAAEILSDLSRATDNNSSPIEGAQWFFYATGTLTPQAVYTTAALDTEHSNPVLADAAGRFPPIYFDASLTYRGILKNAAGATLSGMDIDPINAGIASALAASAGAALVGFLQSGTGAVARTVEDKGRETVTITDFLPDGYVTDGTVDYSTEIQAAIDAHKGKRIIFPAGGTYLAAGITLSGSTYNGTHLVIEGTFLLKAAAGGANVQSVSWGGIIFHDVEKCRIDIPGVMDGNRANQDASQQRHCLMLLGVRDMAVGINNFRELRGDGIFIAQKTLATPSTNTNNLTIGVTNAFNSADDGRNAISIISGENITLAGGTSIKVGGVIAAVRMPGGFDIEPDDSTLHTVKNIRSGPWVIETAGASGIACIGHPYTDDATRDWNIEDVWIAPSSVTLTSGLGEVIFKRNLRLVADVNVEQTTRAQGCTVDYNDFSDVTVRAKNVTNGVSVGFENFVNDSSIHAVVDNHNAAGVLAVGVNRTKITGLVRGGQGAGSYGVQASVASRGTLTQTDVTYSVDVPYDADNSFGFQTSAGLTFTRCVVANCSFTGYPSFDTQFGFLVFLPTRNIQGRNFSTAVPSTGYWERGDIVLNTTPSVGGIVGWICTAQGTPGTWSPYGIAGEVQSASVALAAGANPTKAEFDALVNSLKAANLMA